MKKTLLLLLAAVLIIGCSGDHSTTTEDVALREKIGQMLIVGFHGATPQEIKQQTVGVRQYVQDLNVGGVILFPTCKKNGEKQTCNITSPEQLHELNRYIRSLTSKPLVVCIDQEGGTVIRLTSETGFPNMASAQYLGTQPMEATTAHSHTTATTLSDALFNVNFAPCIDVNVNPENPIIGKRERSFSEDPEKVTVHAAAWIEGHHDMGILTTVKHFPGHGSSTDDSHLGMTDVTNTWKEYELLPYRELIKQNKVDMVMTAHVFNRNLDPDYPATLSKKIIQGLLRDEMGYNGVVVSDDFGMAAIAAEYTFEHALELSINAGVDMIILTTRQANQHNEQMPFNTLNTIEKLVKEGKITQARIDEAYNRIQKMKSRLK